MSDDSHLVRLAVERGWVTREQLRAGRPLRELLTPEQFAELKKGREMADRLLKGGLLQQIVEAPPERFGRYRILRPLGEGGSGRVFLAHDPELRRDVAIKILDRGLPLERFRREMEILATLKHPNIVGIYDAGTEDGRPYYAMEYAGDQSLAGAKLDLRETVKVLERIALACHAAHEKGIVHRDLKPANILLGERPVVVDFGVAKVRDLDLTETGTTVGTPYYLSPEQARAEPVDARSDVYSLGVILYEAMAGRRPFTGTSVLEITRRIVEETPPPPPGPRDLVLVARMAMAKDRNLRYATAREFAADLRAWLEGKPVRAKPPRPRVVRPAIAAAVLVAAVAAFLLTRKTADLPSAEAPPPPPDISGDIRRIDAWSVNLYKAPRQISYDDLEEPVRRIRAALDRLPRDARRDGWFAIARARLFMGRTAEAREALDRAIELGAGGECRFERARIVWEDMLRELLSKNEAEGQRLVEEIKADLRAALKAGIRDEWTRDFARALLRLAEEGEKSVKECLEGLRRLSAVREKPAEEIDKVLGDIHLLMRKPDLAIADYERALRDRQCYVQALNGLSLAHGLRGDDARSIEKALECAYRAIDINPRYEASYFLFAHLCRGVLSASPREMFEVREKIDPRSLAGALERLRTGGRELPDSKPVAIAHGTLCVLLACLEIGRKADPSKLFEEAVPALERAAKLDDRAAEPRLALGILNTIRGSLLKLEGKDDGSVGRAKAALTAALERAPESADAWRWLGYARYVAAEYAGALEAWDRALRLNAEFEAELKPYLEEAKRRRG